MPLLVLLVGGIVADRVESKRFLILITLIAACTPLVLIGAIAHLGDVAHNCVLRQRWPF